MFEESGRPLMCEGSDRGLRSRLPLCKRRGNSSHRSRSDLTVIRESCQSLVSGTQPALERING
jgi:hypothetical protein